MNHSIIFLIALLITCLFRFMTAFDPSLSLFNFSPLMAIAFCAGIFWIRSWKQGMMVLGLLILTDLALNQIHGYPGWHSFMGITLLCYAFSLFFGKKLQSQTFAYRFGGLLASSLLFYFATNTLVWWGSANYAQNFSGWVQSWTIGLPGFPPSYLFLRNSLLSDIGFFLILSAFQWRAPLAFKTNPSTC